jgi:hypothetical protein
MDEKPIIRTRITQIAQIKNQVSSQLPAGHELFGRIVTLANALSAGVPDSDQKYLRALRAFAVQSFLFPTARA